MGALMGQHNGRQITIEHAFECHTTPAPDAPLGYTLDNARFLARLEQCTSSRPGLGFVPCPDLELAGNG